MQDLGDLLHKQMTRKQFLQTIGMLILTVIGVSFLLQYLQRKSNNPVDYGQ